MTTELAGSDDSFFRSIRGILAEARQKAASSVNFIMVEAYWRIGQRIVEEEQGGQTKAAYGKELIKELSKQLGDEFGRGFSFVGRQFRISTETSHFYIDLVFYNYLVKCFVLLDLKIDKLAHQDIGQMDMYVRMFDDLKRGADDNPTLGIILCADKDETIVRYSVLHDHEQLFAAKYLTILPSEEELARELEARHVLDIPTEEDLS
jgi:hypothetical protein